MSVLKEICDYKLNQIKQLKNNFSEKFLLDRIKEQENPRGFAKALTKTLKKNQFALIAELKKASPSKGIIKKDFNIKDIALSYQEAGAACLSVLTEDQWFKGSIEDLQEVKACSNLPVLRKDFILDPWQILESRSIGADCILIILAAVNDDIAQELINLSKNLGIDTLIEVHNENELDRAIKLDGDLIGINNRNLKTLTIDIETTIKLAPRIPKKYDIVSESGIEFNEDLNRISQLGIKRFLVGESLIKNSDIKSVTKKLLGLGKKQ